MSKHSFSYQTLSFNAKLLKARASRYAIYGAMIAAAAIVLATVLSAYMQLGQISVSSLINAQKTNPVLWILDTTPFFFAFWGQSVGAVMSYQAGALMADQINELRTQTAALETQAMHDATHDSVTELPNRILFNDRVMQLIEHSRRNDSKFAIVLLDLDRFKEINDTLGHFNGDRLLKLVGLRLQGILRKSDTLARFGGDEFAILLHTVSDCNAVRAITEKIEQVLVSPFVLDDLNLEIQASAGAVIYPDHGDDVDTLVQRADVAMYVAKQGSKRSVIYEPKLDQHSPHRLTLMGELRQAIENDDLVLHYQPKIKASNQLATSAEVLVRWEHKKHGMMAPDEFIGLAERTGLIKPLTRWVLKHALQQGARWHSSGLKISLAVNLSAKNLLDPDFPEILAGLLAATEFPHQFLVLEITETVIMTDPDLALEVLQHVSRLGVHISVDDFGTGYSSLAYLKRLPVSELKIDRSFVQDMLINDNDAAIVRTTIDLAHNLGLEVVAEGVEDSNTMQVLEALGCDYYQGYYFAKPLEPKTLPDWIHKYDLRHRETQVHERLNPDENMLKAS
jgi:diguanylate cyclase (GGDEF)-like protein